MSYSYTGVRGIPRARGLGLFDNLTPSSSKAKTASVQTLKDQASNVTDGAKQQAIQFADQQLQTYPLASDVLAAYDQYASYLKGIDISGLQDPTQAVQIMKQALINYAVASGIPVDTQGLEDYALKIAQGYTDVPLPAHFPQSVADLKKAAVDIAVTAVIMYTGVDPQLITVTVECLLDGKLSQDDLTSIGTCAGAVAGAVIGQAIGIPAPIGALIGGAAGGMIGGTVAEIFGMGGDAQEAYYAKLQAAAAAWEKSVTDQAEATCIPALIAYWDAFDNMIAATELRWRTAEVKIGWKFGLRWYGQEPISNHVTEGQPFSQAWDPTTHRFVGPVTAVNRATYLRTEKNYGMMDANGDLAHTDYPVYWCAEPSGCPYPTVPNLGAGPYERDAQAFLARGAYWIPPEQRPTKCPLPPGPGLYEPGRPAWVAAVEQVVTLEQGAIGALNTISVAVTGDLVKSAATVAAEKALTVQFQMTARQLSDANIQRDTALSAAKKTGAQLSDLINYSALFIGVGVLGAALYKRSQS